MSFFELREPANALTHGVGLVAALATARHLWRLSFAAQENNGWSPRDSELYKAGKSTALLIFGLTLIACYAASTVFHGAEVSGDALRRLQRLDHVGIYLLIAGTYTPIAWALMRGPWRWGTLGTVWSIAATCSVHVLDSGAPPVWICTITYLLMGWGALFCYRKLAGDHTHRALLPLPLGGVFYSVGAAINLLKWPVLYPGVFGAHSLFHLFVIAGSACHVWFMISMVVPAHEPALAPFRFAWHRPTLAPIPIDVPSDRSSEIPYGIRRRDDSIADRVPSQS